MPYDAIIIGSGAGGLTAAVALAQVGKKVLVLEQHDRPGGWTHSFTLNGYRFSPGVHYIGDLHEGGHFRNIYEELGVSQDLTFCELNAADEQILSQCHAAIYTGSRKVRNRWDSWHSHRAPSSRACICATRVRSVTVWRA